MGRPHKGERARVLLRIPVAIAERVDALGLVDRNEWIVAAISDKLRKDAAHG